MTTHAYKNNSSRYDYSDQFKSAVIIKPKQTSLSWERMSSYIRPLFLPFEHNHDFVEKMNSVVRTKKIMSLLYGFFNIVIGVLGFYMVQHFFTADMPYQVLIAFLAIFSLEVPLGVYQLYRHHRSVRFNSATRQFLSSQFLSKITIDFDNILAVQLLHYTRTQNNQHTLGGTKIYEMNLVLKDQSRVHLSEYYNKETAFENAQTIAGFINIKVIDQLSEEVLSLK